MSNQNEIFNFLKNRTQQIEGAKVDADDLIGFLEKNYQRIINQIKNIKKDLEIVVDAPKISPESASHEVIEYLETSELYIHILNYISNYDPTKPVDCDLKTLFTCRGK